MPDSRPGPCARRGRRRTVPLSETLVNDEEPGAALRGRAVRLGIVGDLVTHAGAEHELASVLQLGVQLAFDAEQDVSLAAPVVRDITRRVLDHAHADAAEIASPPVCSTSITRVRRRLDRRPVRGAEWNVIHLHPASIPSLLPACVEPIERDRPGLTVARRLPHLANPVGRQWRPDDAVDRRLSGLRILRAAGEHHAAVRELAVEPERTAAIVDPGLMPLVALWIVEVEALARHAAGARPVLQQRAAAENLLDAVIAGRLAADSDTPVADPEVELPAHGGIAAGRRRRGRRCLRLREGSRQQPDCAEQAQV